MKKKNRFAEEENKYETKKEEDHKNKEILRIRHKYQKEIERTKDPERQNIYRQRQEEEVAVAIQGVNEKIDRYSKRNIEEVIEDINNRKATLDKKIAKRMPLFQKAVMLDAAIDRKIFTAAETPLGITKSVYLKNEHFTSSAIKKSIYEELYKRFSKEIFTNQDLEKKSTNFNVTTDSTAIITLSYMKRIYGNNTENIDIKEAANEIDDNFDPDTKIRAIEYSKYFATVDDAITAIFKFDNYKWHYYPKLYSEIKKELTNELGAEYDNNKNKIENTAREYAGKILSEKNWLLIHEPKSDRKTYPFNGSNAQKYNWCFKHSFINLDEEKLGAQKIGKIIYTRLENEVDYNLHDATEWLHAINSAKTGYDIKKIKKDVEGGKVIDDVEEYAIKLEDTELERKLLLAMTSMNEEEFRKLKLPTKQQRINQIFKDEYTRKFYQEMIKRPGQKFTLDELNDKNNKNEYASWPTSIWITSRPTSEDSQKDYNARQAGEMIKELLEVAQNRKDYYDDISTYLTRHMMAPKSLLTATTGRDRAIAISKGIEDNAKSIRKYIKSVGFIGSLNEKDLESSGYSKADFDVKGKFYKLVEEMSRIDDYRNEDILEAIKYYDKNHNEEKTCPPAEYIIKNESGNYVATIFAHDDPRGMTIGADTGCCMTIDGASHTCIESGYRDKDAGFFAMYEQKSGRIIAQSYFYTNPEKPEILVLDNIESNSGRDPDKIVDVYKEFFEKYLAEQIKNNPDWKIREVHVGTGYGELVKPIVERLEEAEIVLNPSERYIYTDAGKDQRLLLRLTDEEITKIKVQAEENNSHPKVEPLFKVKHPQYETVLPLNIDKKELIKSLETEIYPEEMRSYEDEDFLYNELTMPGTETYSFIINTEKDATKEPIGYCLAYEAESETNPNYEEKCIYVADFAIKKEARSFGTTSRCFKELIERANRNNIDLIEMGARESTSYKLLTSPVIKRYLEKQGFTIEDHGIEDEFSEDEKTYLLALKRIKQNETLIA